MNIPEHYPSDLLFYFDGRPQELALYEALFQAMSAAFPEARVKVQKSQISFYGRHLFAAVSWPLRRKKTWPEHCLVVTAGLNRRLDSPRVAAAVEPYPGRWTHHILLTAPEEIDDALLDWLEEARAFAVRKR